MPGCYCAAMVPLDDPVRARERRHLLAWLGSLPVLAGGCAVSPQRADGTPAPGSVMPFSASAADGGLPAGWEEYRMRRDIPPTRYFTVDDGGRTVLRAQSHRGSSGLRCPVNADPAAQPWIEWSWRAQSLPAGARADDLDLDDSPARIVLAFDGDIASLPLRDRLFFEQVELFTGQRLPYAMLMYVWDATLPAGQIVSYARSARIRKMVVRSGPEGMGRWQFHRRHIVDDFRAAFGEAPGRLVSVGVLTDADDLRQPMQADYGDIVLRA
jgi:Protein of unknown function (DUF3047)